MKYKYVLFDPDGTLTDPKEGITRCVQYALRRFGIQCECDRLTHFIGPPLKEMFEKCYQIDGNEAVRVYRERFSTVGMYENRVYDGVPDLLARLKSAGMVVALATSKPTVFSLKILKKYDLLQYFDCVVGSELDGRRTDKAEVINEVLRKLGDPDKTEVIMVGDRIFDVKGAQSCGIDCIAVSYGYAPEGELEGCGVIQTVDDVSTLIQALL